MTNNQEQKIEAMREGGKILRNILRQIEAAIEPELDTYVLEELFIKLCKENNVTPSCKGYQVANLPPFPTGLCLGVNEESVHCYPQKGQILREGDIVTVDTVIKHAGYHVDSAFTKGVGQISQEDQRFIDTTRLAANNAFKEAIAGNHVGDIGYAIDSILSMAGFNVLTDFVGHGIGERMHEAPDIPCFGARGRGMELREGMTLAIEILATQGGSEVNYRHPRDWQTFMADGKKFAIFEHTVLVTKDGPEVLTR
jgi:methionyl aminopeptidase